MVGSSATVPILVAVIGVIGAIIPPYINSVISQDYNQPNIRILPGESDQIVLPNTTFSVPTNLTQYAFSIVNSGNVPATNLSVILDVSPMDIVNITNKLSTTDIILPAYNNRILQSGNNQTVNGPLLEIQIAKLIHGVGSILELDTFINRSNEEGNGVEVFAVYDQGSDHLVGILPNTPTLFVDRIYEYWIESYYLVFYGTLAIAVFAYIMKRKRMKRFPREIAKKIMEMRRVLRNDHTSKDIFPENWDQYSDKMHKTIDSMSDYLLFDDFFSELKKRNLYLSNKIDTKQSNLSKTNTISKLNETLLAAAENVLNKVDWNKYR